MAPEQILARSVDARTDVFAFCVALFEALHGERPFRGERWPQLAAAILAGRIDEPSRGARVPPGLRAIVARGLSPAPEHRFADMGELLAALEPWRRPRRPRWLLGLAGVAIVAGLVGAFAGGEDPCAAGDERIAAAWNDARRAAVREAFAGSVDAEPILARLEAWATAWRDAHAIA
jgi:hypothetical protein